MKIEQDMTRLNKTKQDIELFNWARRNQLDIDTLIFRSDDKLLKIGRVVIHRSYRYAGQHWWCPHFFLSLLYPEHTSCMIISSENTTKFYAQLLAVQLMIPLNCFAVNSRWPCNLYIFPKTNGDNRIKGQHDLLSSVHPPLAVQVWSCYAGQLLLPLEGVTWQLQDKTPTMHCCITMQ